jgi:hypothetical protein
MHAWMLLGLADLEGPGEPGLTIDPRPNPIGHDPPHVRWPRSRRRVHVKCDYSVDGTTFRASLLRYRYFGGMFTDDADDVANPYPPDAPVTVHHYPRRPSMSVLEPGFDRANLAFNLGVTVAIFAFAYFMSI